MAEFTIDDGQLQLLKGKVVVLTGGSSGIGLATTKFFLGLGALMVVGDVNPAPIEDPALTFTTVDVTSWSSLSALFKKAIEVHGRIDHVFANAGIGPRTTYFDESLDDKGDLLEPNHTVINVNLKGVINTVALALHYMRKQASGGSIVLTASASSFQRYRMSDYTTAKHGVLGLMRALVPHLGPTPSIRINSIAPSFTETGIVPKGLLESTGATVQSADVVARSVGLLMADGNRQGQLIYSWEGRYKEIEEGILLPAAASLFEGRKNEEDYSEELMSLFQK